MFSIRFDDFFVVFVDEKIPEQFDEVKYKQTLYSLSLGGLPPDRVLVNCWRPEQEIPLACPRCHHGLQG